MISADAEAIPNTSWIEFHWQRARQLGEGCLFIIDEIQMVTDWSRIVKVLYDQDRMKRDIRVVLLGSASLKIQAGLSESLLGRFERIYVPHWTYEECKIGFNYSVEDYLFFGGYPGAAQFKSNYKRWKNYIDYSVIEPVLNRDLLQIARVAKPALFRQTFELIMRYPAQEVSLQKLLGQLQEGGNVSTVKHYLALFEGAFLLKILYKYTASPIQTRHSSPKLLPLNTALVEGGVKSEENRTSEHMGRLLECVVGAKLLSFSPHLYYWREGNLEVDFVLKTSKYIYAIEVKSIEKSKTKGLMAFQKKYPNALIKMVDLGNIEDFFALKDEDEFFTFV